MPKNLGPSNFENLNAKGATKKFSSSAELVPSKKLGPPSLIWGNFKKLRKVLLNHIEPTEV